MNTLQQLKKRRKDLRDALAALQAATVTKRKGENGAEATEYREMTAAERMSYDGTKRELDQTITDIAITEGDEQRSRESLRNQLGRDVPVIEGPYQSLGEQLLDIRRASNGHGEARSKLADVQSRAALGSSEVVDSDGGFLVQSEFVAQLFQRAYTLGQVLPRLTSLPVGANANGITMNAFDDSTMVGNLVAGGIAAYWDGEAGSSTATKPKFRKVDLKLQKLRALVYATDEMLEDSTALEGVIMNGVPKAIQLRAELGVFSGTGAGQMLGFLNSGALLSIAKEVGQSAASIVFENILNMWSRMPADSMGNAVWFINQACLPLLMQLRMVVGTGGVPVWLPATGASGSPFSTLFNRPVVPVPYCAAVGTVGDIVFADLSQYLSINKGGVQAASSIHVQFLTGEQVFRFTMRINGQPLWDKPFTPLANDQTYSPFIALASR